MKKRLTSLLMLISVLGLLASCSFVAADKSITIASKQFTENILLGEMYAQLVENLTDIKVVRNHSMGSTAVCFTAMENKNVDFYVEYTGTICREILNHKHEEYYDSSESFSIMKKELDETKNITLYRSIGPNNTYALAMRKVKAEAMGVVSMSDLSSLSDGLVFGANDIFYARANDGYDTMLEKYDTHFKSVVKMNNPLLYDAVVNDQVDVIVVYATDSLLPKNEMVILDDDKQMFPDYYAIPIARNDILKKYPELDGVFDLLADKIDIGQMQELNYMVDIEGKTPEDVAKEFLTGLGLLETE